MNWPMVLAVLWLRCAMWGFQDSSSSSVTPRDLAEGVTASLSAWHNTSGCVSSAPRGFMKKGATWPLVMR